MFYSSGTTGRPKGIVRPLPARNVGDEDPAGIGLVALFGYGPDTVYLSPAPLYHSAPVAWSTNVHVYGGTVVVMERFDAEEALALIERYRVTLSQWVPTMFSRLLKLPDDVRNRYDLSSHRLAIHAAAPCPVAVKQGMIEWWGPILGEYYAGSEQNGFTWVDSTTWLEHPGTVGRPLLGSLHICDDEGNELSAGEVGIIYFELPAMAFSYHNDPAKTRGSQHPEHPNWSRLGDVGYVDEQGFLFLTDRKDFMIISGGVNIYPQEIEDVLIVHPKVADAAVFGVPNEEFGEEVKAVVQLADGLLDSPEIQHELMEHCREHLAHYKCPRSIDVTDELPSAPDGQALQAPPARPVLGQQEHPHRLEAGGPAPKSCRCDHTTAPCDRSSEGASADAGDVAREAPATSHRRESRRTEGPTSEAIRGGAGRRGRRR